MMGKEFTLSVSCALLGLVVGSAWADSAQRAWSPTPPDGAVNVGAKLVLSWAPGAQAALHDMYLSTRFDEVNKGSGAGPAYRGRQAYTLYDPGTLLPNTRYYWRIDEINETHPQSPWIGAVWSFQTGAAGAPEGGISADYLKMNPPPDVDKSAHHPAPPPGQDWPPTCWLATASNMLAGAGYGNGTSVQQRADAIFDNMTAHFGTANGGWADTAISWWLASSHNIWSATNTYNVVTVYGNKDKIPWANANGAQYLANELRTCEMVGLSISWPRTWALGSPGGGHAITAWGDELGDAMLTGNPSTVRLTDSDDDDTSGDVHTYTYDSYTNPNPGGFNEGNGWYINYGTSHPFIKHIVTLCPAQWGTLYSQLTQKVVGSRKIQQRFLGRVATDLHYRVVTDVPILSYRTNLDVETFTSPVIVESQNRQELTVDWDLSKSPIPFGKTVTITTEVVLADWNGLAYKDVHFTYPQLQVFHVPDVFWRMVTPRLVDVNIPNITGGYVVGSFELIDPNGQVTGEYRLLHEYDFRQDPGRHDFTLWSDPKATTPLQAGNFRFGHSYGFLDTASLWKFEDWMTLMPDRLPVVPGKEIQLTLNWGGRLPYPQGEVYPGKVAPPASPAASNPNPQNQALGVPVHPILSWVSGKGTVQYDVYFGVDYGDVSAASRSAPLGVLASRGQTGNTYDPGVLPWNRTFYWRVDGWTADGQLYKGDVWTFTTEAFAYPVTPIKVTASSFVTGSGPEKTINGSGLNAGDQHSTNATDMWQTNTKLPQWIQYEFDKTYKLHEMWVWNSNQIIEGFLGYGAKNVTIEYSTDGATWMVLAKNVEFARAPGDPAYSHNTTVTLGGLSVRYIRLTIRSNWSGVIPGCGLSEVRFFALR